ncbi:MAG: hypothetical protein MJ231_08640 [bacterium]|nr:hypothetical protein [bacterium]
MINPITTNNQTSFTSLKPITRKANRLSNGILNNVSRDLYELTKNVDMEIIPKKGLFSKIKSLVFYVTKGNKSDWFSLSIDPKGYMPTNNPRYLTVKFFTEENILSSANNAIKNMNKYKMQIKKPSLPADAVLLAKLLGH